MSLLLLVEYEALSEYFTQSLYYFIIFAQSTLSTVSTLVYPIPRLALNSGREVGLVDDRTYEQSILYNKQLNDVQHSWRRFLLKWKRYHYLNQTTRISFRNHNRATDLIFGGSLLYLSNVVRERSLTDIVHLSLWLRRLPKATACVNAYIRYPHRIPSRLHPFD